MVITGITKRDPDVRKAEWEKKVVGMRGWVVVHTYKHTKHQSARFRAQAWEDDHAADWDKGSGGNITDKDTPVHCYEFHFDKYVQD